jgi:hypothetical protein
MPDTPLLDRVRAYHEPRWNSLIPKHAIATEVIPNVGVRYLHATKGWRYVSKKRFIVRGIL